MHTLKLAILSILLLLQGQVYAVSYEVNKNTSMRDDQGGSFVTRSTGSLSQAVSLVSANTAFDSFLFRENPRILLSGELGATLSGTQSNYNYTLNGTLDVQVGERSHAVQFDNMRVVRRGVAVDIEGELRVDGEDYEVREGSLAEEIIVTIIILQDQ